MKELVLGCGRTMRKQIYEEGESIYFPGDAVRVDINPDVNPTIVHDLNIFPWPFEDSRFDIIHAYNILEHLGSQGDSNHFFLTFEEIWRILKPNGILRASVPRHNSIWMWGDPGHRRIINEGSLIFLSKAGVERNRLKGTSMTEYTFKGDFEIMHKEDIEETFNFVLRAIK